MLAPVRRRISQTMWVVLVLWFVPCFELYLLWLVFHILFCNPFLTGWCCSSPQELRFEIYALCANVIADVKSLCLDVQGLVQMNSEVLSRLPQPSLMYYNQHQPSPFNAAQSSALFNAAPSSVSTATSVPEVSSAPNYRSAIGTVVGTYMLFGCRMCCKLCFVSYVVTLFKTCVQVICRKKRWHICLPIDLCRCPQKMKKAHHYYYLPHDNYPHLT